MIVKQLFKGISITRCVARLRQATARGLLVVMVQGISMLVLLQVKLGITVK